MIPFTGDRAETGAEGPRQNTGVSEGGHGRKAGSQAGSRGVHVCDSTCGKFQIETNGGVRTRDGEVRVTRVAMRQANRSGLGTFLIVYFLTQVEVVHVCALCNDPSNYTLLIRVLFRRPVAVY